jgi:hypothetical protein
MGQYHHLLARPADLVWRKAAAERRRDAVARKVRSVLQS